MTTHIYVDETKAKGYLVAAATGTQAHLTISRKELRGLILPGQRSLHMNSERDQRRREILDTLVRMGDLQGLEAVLYDAGSVGTEKERRARCLEALVSDAVGHGDARIVFDLDESLQAWDRQQMVQLTRALSIKDRIAYEHRNRHSDPLLAIPDAIAWAWARGGDWRNRIRPIVREVQKV